MRFAVFFVALILAGCAVSKPDATASATGTKTALPAKPSTAGRGQKVDAKPQVTLDQGVQGTVVAVNPVLRFLVMDFTVRKLPVLDQRLNIYRNGQKVGEVKVTGPGRDTTIAGDIMAGEVQVGDEVRED